MHEANVEAKRLWRRLALGLRGAPWPSLEHPHADEPRGGAHEACGGARGGGGLWLGGGLPATLRGADDECRRSVYMM